MEESKNAQIEKVKKILSKCGIKLQIGGCGCCGSPWVSFKHNGEKIVDSEDDFAFDMFTDEEDTKSS